MISELPAIQQRIYDKKAKAVRKRPVRKFRRQTTVNHGQNTASDGDRTRSKAVWSEAEKVFRVGVA